MPYLDQALRPLLDSAMVGLTPKSEAELNYVFTKLALQFVNRNGKSYKTYNAVMGAFECAKLELYRTDVSDYEIKKRDLNGRVE